MLAAVPLTKLRKPHRRPTGRVVCSGLVWLALTTVSMGPAWGQPSFSDWLAAATLDDPQQAEVARLREAAPLDLGTLDRVTSLYADASPRVAELLSGMQTNATPASRDALQAELPVVVVSDIALRLAAQHCFRRRYESALAWLDLVDAGATSAPQLYWYYRAVACHQLVRMDDAQDAVQELQQIDAAAGRRIDALARLIARDAESHKPGSLTHVGRQMEDVRRRLKLGSADQPNQLLQEDVLAALDKLIEDAEEQRRQQQQSQQSAQIAQQPGARPMEQSRIAELKGAGEVDDREIPPGGDWGALPPAERERVTQQIIRDFPSHYREVIKDYFRSLATEPGEQGAEP